MSDFSTYTGIKQIRSHFGTRLHGAQLTWYHDQAAGETAIQVEFKQYLHSRLYTYYDPAVDNVNSEGWYVGQYDLSSWTETTNVYLDTKATSEPLVAQSDFVFHIQFTNPVTSGTPAYDGIYAAATATVNYDDSTTATRDARTVSVAWDSNVNKDLVPSDDFDKATFDADNACTDDLWTQGALPTEMCTEQWRIGSSGIACVELTGELTREMTATETDCDLTLDYVEYTVGITIGTVSEADVNYVQFTQTVDFNDFIDSGAFALTSSTAIGTLVGMLALGY